MRSDLITPSTRLQRATKKIQDRWIETKSEWDDRVSEQFQHRYLDPIVPQLQLTLVAIRDLMEVLDKGVAETRDEMSD